MKKKEFWIKFSLYVLFGLMIPLSFLTWRFQLFSKVSKISISGWGLVAIILFASFFISMIKMVRKGLPFSIYTQVLDGLVKKVIPLIIIAYCSYYMKDLMEQVFQFLCVYIVCQLVSIIVNPLPAWLHEHKMDDSKSTLKDVLTSLGITGDKK